MGSLFRRYLAITTVGAFALILLGVYTGKVGAGLACEGRWPFCDGWLGLFPATWPSFIEWFHRLVAMVVGFMILGAGIVSWRGGYDRRIQYALAVAIVLLPVQIFFGANTVLNFGVAASMLHQTAAQLIFAALVVATTLAYQRTESQARDPDTANQSAAARLDD
ncbi:MAG: COX15/CtaA family protein [Halovenus sp.]